MWEIWSRCSCLPYSTLSNEELYQNLLRRQAFYSIESKIVYQFSLSQPSDCPKEIYDLLTECWQIDGSKRPHISDIGLFLKRQMNLS